MDDAEKVFDIGDKAMDDMSMLLSSTTQLAAPPMDAGNVIEPINCNLC